VPTDAPRETEIEDFLDRLSAARSGSSCSAAIFR
jgi:hypothetical protein